MLRRQVRPLDIVFGVLILCGVAVGSMPTEFYRLVLTPESPDDLTLDVLRTNDTSGTKKFAVDDDGAIYAAGGNFRVDENGVMSSAAGGKTVPIPLTDFTTTTALITATEVQQTPFMGWKGASVGASKSLIWIGPLTSGRGLTITSGLSTRHDYLFPAVATFIVPLDYDSSKTAGFRVVARHSWNNSYRTSSHGIQLDYDYFADTLTATDGTRTKGIAHEVGRGLGGAVPQYLTLTAPDTFTAGAKATLRIYKSYGKGTLRASGRLNVDSVVFYYNDI